MSSSRTSGGDVPYRPPPIGGPSPTGDGLRIRAIVVGVVVDWVGTVFATVAIMFGVGVVLAVRLGADADIDEQMNAIVVSREFALLMAFVGTAFVSLGGFFAGIIARQEEIKHASIMGLVSLALGAATQLLPIEEQQPVWNPDWFRFLSIAVVVPAAALGGFLARLRRRDPYS